MTNRYAAPAVIAEYMSTMGTRGQPIDADDAIRRLMFYVGSREVEDMYIAHKTALRLRGDKL